MPHISHQNDNQYVVKFNYNTIVGDFEDYSASHKSQTADNSATDSKSKKEKNNNDDAKQQITKQRTEIQNTAENSVTDSKSKKETSNNNDDAKQQIPKKD